MNKRLLPALAGAAVLMGLAGRAGAAQTLTTSPFDVDHYGYEVYCDASNVSAGPVMFVTEFCDGYGTVVESFGPEVLAPGNGSTHLASAGNSTFYCRIVVQAGSAKSLRAAAIITKNGRYLATAEAR